MNRKEWDNTEKVWSYIKALLKGGEVTHYFRKDIARIMRVVNPTKVQEVYLHRCEKLEEYLAGCVDSESISEIQSNNILVLLRGKK